MANTDLLNFCELFQIINDVGYKGSLLESPAPHTVPITPHSAMAQMETQRGNKGETTNPKISDRFKHFRVGNLLIISTSLSRDCEILQRP